MRGLAAGAVIVVALCVAPTARAAHRADASAAKLKPDAKRTTLRLLVPKPGHVTIAAVRLRMHAGARISPHPFRFRLVNGRVARHAELLVARRVRQTGGRTTLSYLLVVLNSGAKRALASTARVGDTPKQPVPEVNFDQAAAFAFLLTGVDVSREVHEHDYEVTGINSELKRCRKCGEIEFRELQNADTSPFRAQFTDEGTILFPKGKTIDPNLDTGHYDDGHSFGWKKTSGKKSAWENLTEQLMDDFHGAPATEVESDVRELYQVAGVPFPGGAKCVASVRGACLARFSFPNIHVTWQAPPDNFGTRENMAFDVSGTACGTDATTANWAITTSGAGLPPTTLNNVFKYTNPYPALDWRWAGSKNSQPAELQGKLRLTGGAAPTMAFETAKLGAGAAEIGGPTVSAASVPVTAKRVAAC